MSPENSNLPGRVARLERSNARLRAALGVAGLAAAAVVLGGQDRPESESRRFERVEVRRLVLVDGKGATRAELAVEPDGRAGLEVVPVDGERAAFFGMSRQGDPCLALRNDRGMAQVVLTVDGGGDSAAVIMCNAAGKPRASTTIAKDGTPLLGLFDDRDGYRASLSVMPDGSPYLKLDNTRGALRIAAQPELEWSPK